VAPRLVVATCIALALLSCSCGASPGTARSSSTSSAGNAQSAAEALLRASSFTVDEVDSASMTSAADDYTTTAVGVRTPTASLFTLSQTQAVGKKIVVTVYLSLHVYCHLAPDLSGGGWCIPVKQRENYLTFASLGVLQSLAAGLSKARVTGSGFTFSGSIDAAGAASNWHGTGTIATGYVKSLSFTASDPSGVQRISATFSKIGISEPIRTPSSLPATGGS
jgi:hypothetical protein